MAVAYNWSELNDTVAFNALEDTLYFDDLAISAAGLGIVPNDAEASVQFTAGGKTVALAGVSLASLTTTNVTFADGSQLIVGDEQQDSLWDASPTDDRLLALGGNDAIYGNGGNNVLDGGAGNDVIYSGAVGHNTVLGGDGTDWLELQTPTGVADGGAGNDYLSVYADGSHLLTGGSGEDMFYLAGQGAQITDFAAGAGGDRLDVNGLVDHLTSYESGNPFGTGFLAFEQQGADTHLMADPDGAGPEAARRVATLQNVDASQLTAENLSVPMDPTGADSGPVQGVTELGVDRFFGTIGDDTVTGTDSNDEMSGYYGDDRIAAGGGDDRVQGNQGHDILVGGDGDDALFGDSGNDSVEGGQGNDRLYGQEGDDTLIGGDGDDELSAGTGMDVLTGGAGRDYFDLSESGFDVVTDFAAGAAGDVITTRWLDLTNYAGGDPFASGHFRLAQEDGSSQTSFLIDLDGAAGPAGFESGAVLENVAASSLTADNFENGFAPIVNRAPQPVADAFATNEDVPLAFTQADLLANDSDPDGDALSFGWVQNEVNGTVNVDGTGITFQPHSDFNGAASFTYTVLDATGAFATATVNIDVAPVNDLPRFDRIFANDPSGPQSGNILIEAWDPEGDPFSITSVAGQALGTPIALDYGTLTVQADGSYTLQLDPVKYATIGLEVNQGQSLEVGVSEPAGSGISHLAVTIRGVNDAPVAQAFADVTATTGQAFSLDVTPAFADVDVGDYWRTWTAAYDTDGDQLYGDAQPDWLSFDGASRVFTGTPDAAGTIGVQLTGTDPYHASALNTFDIAVQQADAAPLAVADTLSTDEDVPFTFSQADLLANDSDPDGDALSFGSVYNSVNGSVGQDGTSFTFWPYPNFSGTASFSYTVYGAGGDNPGTATVSVDVAPVDDLPNFERIFAKDPAGPQTGNILAEAWDAEGDPFTITSFAGQAFGTPIALDYGTLTVQADGNYILELDPAKYATIGLEYREFQSLEVGFAQAQGSGVSNISVVLEGVNDAPVAQPFADVAATTGQALTLDVTPAFADVDVGDDTGGTWTAAYDTDGDQLYGDVQPAWLSFDGNSRTFTGTPDAAGTIGVQLTGRDIYHATALNTFAIVVASEVIDGQAIDGYIWGATVFGDADRDGLLDTGEISAITGLSGEFTLVGASGPLVAQGGTDLATGLPFGGTLRAPEGATVITPLTTVVAALVDQGQTVADATANVSSAFGIDAGIDILSFDPIPGAVAGDAAAAQAYAAGIQVQNAVVQSSALLEGAGVANAGQAVVNQLANLAATGSPVDLADAATAQALISAAAGTTDVSAVAADAAAVLAAANGEVVDALSAVIPIDMLTGLAQAAAVAQGSAVTSDLAQAGASGDAGTLVADYTGANLQALVSNAVVGDVNGSANTAPALDLPDQSAAEGAAFSFVLPADHFVDPDGDALTYSVSYDSNLNGFFGTSRDTAPGWLSFDPATYTFHGTPGSNAAGVVDVRVTASDGVATASDVFRLTVQNTNQAPVAAFPTMVFDTSFAEDGVASASVPGSSESSGNVVALQDDGAIIAAGTTHVYGAQPSSSTAVVRYLPNGSLDTTFGSGGTAVADISPGMEWVTAVEVAADGKIVVAGFGQAASTGYAIGIARFNADGSADTSFAGDGSLLSSVVGYEVANDMALQADGKILVAGTSLGAMSLTRFNQDGSLDTSFAGDGTLAASIGRATYADSVAVQDDGKIVLSGRATLEDYSDQMAVARFNADGTLDATFGSDGWFLANLPGDALIVNDMALLPDGDFAVSATTGSFSGEGGDLDVTVVKVTADGAPDPSFGVGGTVTVDMPYGSYSNSLAVGPDGAIHVLDGGSMLARLNPDGTLNGGITPAGQLVSAGGQHVLLAAIAVQADGAVVGAGWTSGGGIAAIRLVEVRTSLTGQTATEDAPFTYALPTGHFVDPDGDALTYTSSYDTNLDGTFGDAAAWLAFDAVTGTFTGTPGNGDAGAVDVRVSASDGSLEASDAFRLTVAGINDAPVSADILAQAAIEGAAFSLDVTGYFTDPDGDALQYTALFDADRDGTAGEPGEAGWLSFDAATRTFSGTPGDFDIGVHTVSVTATDPAGTTASESFSLTVANVNDLPVAGDDLASAQEDTPLTLDPAVLFANDTDGDDAIFGGGPDARIVDGVGAAQNGSVAFDGTNIIFTPTGNFNGAASFTYTVRDAAGATDSATVNVQVGAVNDAPTASAAPLPNQAVTAGSSFSYAVPGTTFTDVDSTLAFSSSYDTNADAVFGDAAPAWLAFDAATMTFSGTPGAANAGTVGVRVIASDGEFQASKGFDITVTAAPPAPFIGGPGSDFFNGTGAGDLMQGNGGNDLLYGAGGDDLLYGGTGNDGMAGGTGNDLLDGGAGRDAMAGGAGDDTYFVDQSGDLVVEFPNGGTDKVVSTVTYSLGANVENLELAGAAKINGTGNSLNNTLLGNAAANRLDGGRGDDAIDGGGGNDSLTGGDGNDVITARNGTVSISAGSGADIVNLHNAGGTASLGSGSDIVYLNEWTTGRPALIVSDFNTRADTVDYSGLLSSGQLTGYDGTSDPFATGYLTLVQVSAGRRATDTHLQVDSNGGGDGYQTAVVLKNVTRSSLNEGNLVGVRPGAPQGTAAAQLSAVAALTMLETSALAAAPQGALALADLPATNFSSTGAVAGLSAIAPQVAMAQFKLPTLGEAVAAVTGALASLAPGLLEKIAPVIERVTQHFEPLLEQIAARIQAPVVEQTATAPAVEGAVKPALVDKSDTKVEPLKAVDAPQATTVQVAANDEDVAGVTLVVGKEAAVPVGVVATQPVPEVAPVTASVQEVVPVPAVETATPVVLQDALTAEVVQVAVEPAQVAAATGENAGSAEAAIAVESAAEEAAQTTTAPMAAVTIDASAEVIATSSLADPLAMVETPEAAAAPEVVQAVAPVEPQPEPAPVLAEVVAPVEAQNDPFALAA